MVSAEGGTALAEGPSARSAGACLSFNKLQEIFLKKEQPHAVLILCYKVGSRWGFRAAFGSAPVDKFP